MKKYILIFSLLFFGFLFFNISSAHAATLYYNNAAVDGDWNNTANWWTDDGFSIPGSIPTTNDNVIISGDLSTNGGPAASVKTMTVSSTSDVAVDITVASGATFNDSSFNDGTLSGSATFNDSSANSATVSANAIFNNSSGNFAIVSGNATFNDSSANTAGSSVVGNAIFNDSTSNDGTVSLDATFNDSSFNEHCFQTIIDAGGHPCVNGGHVTGNATFNDSSYNDFDVAGNATFNDSTSNNWIVTGDAVFNGSSTNSLTISGNAIFNDTSYNNGTVSGDAVFNNDSYNISTVSGNATFNDTSYNGGFVGLLSTFNGSSYNNSEVNGSAIFSDLSYNSSLGIVDVNASFFDSTINHGAVSGDACFATTADQADGSVSGAVSACAVSLPIVTTNPATRQSSSSEKLEGTITDTGGESITPAGFQYGRTETYGTTVSQAGPFVRETLNSIITSLNNCGIYHYRAFATNSAGTSYGNDVTFVVNACGSASGRSGGSTTQPPITPPVIPTTDTVCPVGNLFSTSTGLPCTSFETPKTPSNLLNITRILRLRMTGDDVKNLQIYLNTHGYPLAASGPGSSGNETSGFGPLTYAAVVKFQKAHNLIPDGVVGPKTLAALISNI